MNDRCPDTDVDAGWCQLRVGHEGVHAALGEHAYQTWFLDEMYSWSLARPPQWMLELPWLDEYRPSYRAERAS